jgi:EAL domain-containing protein (putative c-di-GMP-specific phosphodiesterase class I)
VAECLDTTGFDPDRLWLEITESALLADERTAGRTCAGLVDLGVHLAIDDFGTGFGSLTYLLQFPVEAIKIDRSFVAGIGVGDGAAPTSARGALRGAAIVSSLVGLSEKLGLLCIAEGVERQEQLDALVELGCPLAQGHHLGRPAREPRLPEPVDQPSPDVVAAGTRGGPLHAAGEGV